MMGPRGIATSVIAITTTMFAGNVAASPDWSQHYPSAQHEPYRAFGVATRTDVSRVHDVVRQQLNTIRALDTNWDGYGSSPIEESVIAQLAADLRPVLRSENIYPPDIVPGGDGSLQAEWRIGDFLLTYNVGADGTRYFFAQTGNADSIEVFGPEAASSLQKFASHLQVAGHVAEA